MAHAAVRVKDSKFRAFFMRVRAKKGNKTAYVDVGRKMLTVIWHLLVNGEKYVEDGFGKTAVRRELFTMVMFLWRRWLRF